MRLIDADELWNELGILYEHNKGKVNWNDALLEIKNAPTIEPERKRGKWEKPRRYHTWCRCSECGIMPVRGRPNYCPNCGVKMER